MNRTVKTLIGAAAVGILLAGASAAFAAEPIIGVWKRDNGTLIEYAASGAKFCGTVRSGKYNGKSIGCMKGSGGKYKGEVIVLDEGKTYTGKAKVSGATLNLAGCAFGGLICKGADLKRQ